MGVASPRYVLKPDPHSSHSVILRWLGEGRGRRLLAAGQARGRRGERRALLGGPGAALPAPAGELASAMGGRHPFHQRGDRPEGPTPARLSVHRAGPPEERCREAGGHMSVTRSTPKVVVVMPAYNAGRTLRLTYEELPKDTVNLVILVDDGSTDATLDVARQL